MSVPQMEAAAAESYILLLRQTERTAVKLERARKFRKWEETTLSELEPFLVIKGLVAKKRKKNN